MSTLRTSNPIAIAVEGEKEGTERIVGGCIPIQYFLQLLLVSWKLLKK